MIIFAYPLLFSLLALPFLFYYLMPSTKGLHGDALKIPFIADLKRISISAGSVWNNMSSGGKASLKFWMLFVVWSLLCIAAARPQILGAPLKLKNETRDIMLVLDISTSMLESDFSYANRRITRLDAVRKVISDFADKRANDRMGLILFGTKAYMQAPLTYDKASVKDILWSMQAGMAGDSTSIGDALALALKKIRDDKTDNKVIILLTDGENNDGSLSLAQAIKLAADEKIKVYTIGVGSANVFFKMLSLPAVGVDEKGLNLLAKATKGQYFRAENTADLQKIYNMIDDLEPDLSDSKYVQETTELYYIPLLLAVLISLVLGYVYKGAK